MLKNCKGKCCFTHVTQMCSPYDSWLMRLKFANMFPIWLMRLKVVPHANYETQIWSPNDYSDSKLFPIWRMWLMWKKYFPLWLTFFPIWFTFVPHMIHICSPYNSCDSNLIPIWQTHWSSYDSCDSHWVPIWAAVWPSRSLYGSRCTAPSHSPTSSATAPAPQHTNRFILAQETLYSFRFW